MFAHSSVDQEKMEKFASNFNSVVGHSTPAQVGGGASPPAAPPPADQAVASHEALTMAELQGSIERLKEDLTLEIENGKIELSLQPRGLVMSLRESAFFAPGEAELQPESMVILAKVAQALTRIPGEIRLEGHTDDKPIRTYLYPSNWQLSTARAITVLKLLARRYHVSPERMAVAGYGEFHPLVANDTPENRAKNRRVDVVILTKDAAEMEPEQALSSPRAGRD